MTIDNVQLTIKKSPQVDFESSRRDTIIVNYQFSIVNPLNFNLPARLCEPDRPFSLFYSPGKGVSSMLVLFDKWGRLCYNGLHNTETGEIKVEKFWKGALRLIALTGLALLLAMQVSAQKLTAEDISGRGLLEKYHAFQPVGYLFDGSTYYFLEDGSCFHGWIDLDGGRYYFLPDGSMASGWQELNGKRFYFGDDGTLVTGWLEDGEYRYYLTHDDGALTGAQLLDDKAYYFTPDGIYVLLVNDDNPVPKSYVPELVDLDGRHKVAPVCLEPLTNMLTDCLKAGGEYSVNNTYRSYAEQKDILQTRYERYLEADPELSDNDAWQKALAEVARPGTSEHQTGLCMDINGAGVESVPWLLEHCWEYGFILRFPEGKKDITGIVYEPWHFRYVGTRVSIPMRDSGLCLEEYLGAA